MIDETTNTNPGVPGGGTVPPATDPNAQAYGQVPYTAVPPPPPPMPGAGPMPTDGSNPSPVLAALLGLIPGVGAMYNGQYAKGIAHLIIFGLLESLEHAASFFGILTFGWVVYQAFDAYHTAIARRDGMPVPDPLGLNNIGDVFAGHVHRNTAGAARPYATGTGTGAWGAPAAPFVPPAAPVVPPAAPYTPAEAAHAGGPPYAVPYTAPYGTAYAPPAATGQPIAPPVYAPVATGAPADWNYPGPLAAAGVVPVRNRFPGGAIWLIGLGVLFLIMEFVPDFHLNANHVFPFILMALGISLLIRRLSNSGGIQPQPGEGDGYNARVCRGILAPAVLFTVGVLAALDNFDVVAFHRTWPILIIMIGVALMLQRTAQAKFASAAMAQAVAAQTAVPVAPAPVPTVATTITTATNDEGRGY